MINWVNIFIILDINIKFELFNEVFVYMGFIFSGGIMKGIMVIRVFNIY